MGDIQCRQGECPEIVELFSVAAARFVRMTGLGSRVVRDRLRPGFIPKDPV
jgi:hypothetical protein